MLTFPIMRLLKSTNNCCFYVLQIFMWMSSPYVMKHTHVPVNDHMTQRSKVVERSAWTGMLPLSCTFLIALCWVLWDWSCMSKNHRLHNGVTQPTMLQVCQKIYPIQAFCIGFRNVKECWLVTFLKTWNQLFLTVKIKSHREKPPLQYY